jgi:hypothetical protein
MTDYKCQNGDLIRVGGVYVGPECNIAVCKIDPSNTGWPIRFSAKHGYENGHAPLSFKSELPRDSDGFYIWNGGDRPVPCEWVVQVKTRTRPDGVSNTKPASYWVWNAVTNPITAFKVISTGAVDVQEVSREAGWNKNIIGHCLNIESDRKAQTKAFVDEILAKKASDVPEVDVPTESEKFIDECGLVFEDGSVGATDTRDIYMANTPQGYDDMAYVLVRALEQASLGKGKDRHAQDKPFCEQPMQRLIDLYGPGFAFGQAGKKMQEAQRLEHDPAIREILGAIVYAAGAIISMERGK